MKAISCCQDMAATQTGPSPFSKMIVLGWFDGPTYGLLQCKTCGQAYKFEQLVADVDGLHDFEAWDRGEEIRIFALTELPSGSFVQVVEELSQYDQPKWPVWIWHPGYANPVQIPLPTLDRLTQDIKAPSFVVATNGGDLLGKIINGEALAEDVHLSGWGTDWFARLGLVETKKENKD